MLSPSQDVKKIPDGDLTAIGIVSLGLVSLTTYAILKKKKILSKDSELKLRSHPTLGCDFLIAATFLNPVSMLEYTPCTKSV